MTNARDVMLEWAGAGRLADVRRALALTGVTPDGPAWRKFASALTLWMGAVFLTASAGFFIAYNWQALGRFGKFALVETLLVVAVATAAIAGLDRAAGKAALLAAALLTGTLLALIGQTYQTGADPYELFAVWAVLILPWAAIGRLPALWILVVGLVNLAATLYFHAFRGIEGLAFGGARQLWVLFGINTVALVLWEVGAGRGMVWMTARWPARLLATASGALVTFLAVHAIGRVRHGALDDVGGALAAIAWIGIAYWYYRRRFRDLYMLAGGVLITIIVSAWLVARTLGSHMDAGGMLLVGLLVIGMAAAGARWLRSIAAEES